MLGSSRCVVRQNSEATPIFHTALSRKLRYVPVVFNSLLFCFNKLNLTKSCRLIIFFVPLLSPFCLVNPSMISLNPHEINIFPRPAAELDLPTATVLSHDTVVLTWLRQESHWGCLQHGFQWGLSQWIYPLVICYIAMENGPFIDALPIRNGDFPWQQVTNYQMVSQTTCVLTTKKCDLSYDLYP